MLVFVRATFSSIEDEKEYRHNIRLFVFAVACTGNQSFIYNLHPYAFDRLETHMSVCHTSLGGSLSAYCRFTMFCFCKRFFEWETIRAYHACTLQERTYLLNAQHKELGVGSK